MDFKTLKELRNYFEISDLEALIRCKIAFEKEQDEYYPLYTVARGAIALNPLIISMEQGEVVYNNDIDEAYRTLVRTIIESLDGRIEAHIMHDLNFAFDATKKEFRCRRCGQRVGWEHPDLPGKYMFSSCCEGNEAEGICYDCWSKDHEGE